MRDQIKDEELKNMMEVDEQDENDEDHPKINEKFVKGTYQNEDRMSDSAEVSLQHGNDQELDDDDDDEDDDDMGRNDNHIDDDDDDDAKDF